MIVALQILLSLEIPDVQTHPTTSNPTVLNATSLWQNRVDYNSSPRGLELRYDQNPFLDWVAARFKNRAGTLYTRKGAQTGDSLTYSLNENGSGYVYNPVITPDKVFFRFGKVENSLDGFNLLYVSRTPSSEFKVGWVSPERLFYNRVEFSPSGRYVAYMMGGGFLGAEHGFRGAKMALRVTDTQTDRVADVDTGDWINGTFWWEGETLRFLNLRKEKLSPDASTQNLQPAGTKPEEDKKPALTAPNEKAKVQNTQNVIDVKKFEPVSGVKRTVGRAPYMDKLSLLENYYNAFLGTSYTKKRPVSTGEEALMESIIYDTGQHRMLFATRQMVEREAKDAKGWSYFNYKCSVQELTGKDQFRSVAEFKLRSFNFKPDIKLFRAGGRIFAGVTTYTSTRSTYAPDADVFFPSRTMTIYEIKDGRAEVISQEENSFGLSQIIDGVSVYVTY